MRLLNQVGENTMNSNRESHARYLSVKDVADRYAIGKSTVWYWVSKGRLPNPYKLSENTTRWKLLELDELDAKR